MRKSRFTPEQILQALPPALVRQRRRDGRIFWNGGCTPFFCCRLCCRLIPIRRRASVSESGQIERSAL